MNSVAAFLRRWASETPDGVAVLGIEPDSVITYAQLRDRVLGLAAELRSRGVTGTDVVLVSLPNGPENLVAILGVMVAAVCAPMNPAYTRDELERLATAVRAVAIVTDPAVPGPATELAHRLGLTMIPLGEANPRRTFDEVPQDAIALLLHTAGTTATPKQVPLSHSNLGAAARNVVASLELTPSDRCLNVMPLFHSHGLLGAALSTLTAGGSIVCTPGMDPRHFLDWARVYECTWYTAAPTVHRLVMDAPGEWSGFRFMRSASAPLAPQVAEKLESRFGAPMIEVYGMTESYQIAANPLPPGERRQGSVGHGTGTEIALLDESAALRYEGHGELLVRGPALFRGYSAPPDANQGAFIEGWFRTGDLGRLDRDGYLWITGRVKDQINRAGEKISPREVEEVMLDYPGVIEVLAFGVPDPLLGEDIIAAVVTAPGSVLDVGAARAFLATKLAAFKVPRRILSVDEIPKSDTGKHQRQRFALAYAEGRVGVLDREEGHASTEPLRHVSRLAGIWQDVLKLDAPPLPSDRFFDLGGDSLAVMELVVQIEHDFGIDLPLVAVHQVPSLAEMAAHLDDFATLDHKEALLRPYRHGGNGTHVVLIAGQFGLSVGLNFIADAIGSGPKISLFDYPGHRPGQEPARSIEELGSALVDEIVRGSTGERLVLYGNSMGSWVALDAAQRLAELGHRPVLVGIGDMYSPYFNVDRSGVRPPLKVRALNHLRRLRRRLQAFSRAQAAASGADATAIRRRSAVRWAAEAARRAYRPYPYDGDLLVFSTPSREAKFGESLGYERHVAGRIRSVRLGGEHSNMHIEQATPIGRALADLSGASTPREAAS